MKMRRPVIFSGTTEGRIMSERLSLTGADHIVCVATEYGELVMREDPHAEVRKGRLSADEMAELIKSEAGIVFDATHPYASIVSENIRRACETAGVQYVRVLRDEDGMEKLSDSARIFADAAECAGALSKTEGNILLTTGSKELGVYAKDAEVRSRLFARVLPSEESIRLCREAGLEGRQIIAMQGPFTAEMDKAVIRQYDIKVMVTKSSGSAGGFPEKMRAAAECGISVFVIGRPADEEGVSAEEALAEHFGIGTPDENIKNEKKIHIDLVGIGPGRQSLMSEEARAAIDDADILFGAARMTEPYAHRETYPYYLARDIIPVIEDRKPGKAAVLFSGDTGYCSGAAKMRPQLEEWLSDNGFDYEIVTHPGLSSFAYLAAKTGVPYTDAALLSLHGKSGDAAGITELAETIRKNVSTFLLLSGADDVRLLGKLLADNGLGSCRVVLGNRLSYPDESIKELGPSECLEVTEAGLYIALILNPEPKKTAKGRPLMPVIADDEFIRAKVPMTKENIRHLSVLRLGLREGSAVYDIGSGTGSVACEIAAIDPSVKVYAIEMKDEACGLIAQNAAKFGLPNIRIIKGRAPEAMEGLEAPTHAFVGGSSGDLKDIMACLSRKSRAASHGIRVVINAVSLETMAGIQSVLKEFEISDLTIEQISVNRSRELGSYHLMTAENPVMIASFTLGGK